MASRGEVTPLDYTPTLVDWAERFSDLPGFVYLDSGTSGHGGELEVITALPTVTHRLQDYSANLDDWMTALEADLHSACACSSIVGTSACFTGCVAIGSLDYDAPAASLRAQEEPHSRTMAGLYHWLLVTHRRSQTTELLIHGSLRSLKPSTPLCPEAFSSWSTFVPP